MGDDLLQSRLNQMVRFGSVVARDPAAMRVQVKCSDTVCSALTTDWLQVLVPRASGDMVYDLPDIGDQVICLFLPNGLERGFVLGSLYGGSTPPVSSEDKYHRIFRDGAVLEYDRSSHALTASLPSGGSVTASVPGGKVSVSCAQAEFACESTFTVTAPAIQLNGVIGTASAGGGAGSVTMNGTVNVTQDVVADGVSLKSHVHRGVQTGGGTTGTPV